MFLSMLFKEKNGTTIFDSVLGFLEIILDFYQS